MVDITTPENGAPQPTTETGEGSPPPKNPFVTQTPNEVLAPDVIDQLPENIQEPLNAWVEIAKGFTNKDKTLLEDSEEKRQELRAMMVSEFSAQDLHEQKILIAGAKFPDHLSAKFKSDLVNMLRHYEDVRKAVEPPRENLMQRRGEPGFRTFNAEYLTDDERARISVGGPAAWESFKNEIISLLTADPNADVSQDRSLRTKIDALKEYIRDEGARYFIERDIPQSEARRRTSEIINEIGIDVDNSILLHNVVRGARASSDIEEMAKIFGQVNQELLNKLTGRSLKGVLRRIVSDSARIYEQAAIGHIAKKYRRIQYLEEKEKSGAQPLTPDEQIELGKGYVLENEDLVPMRSLEINAQEKSNRLNVWKTVHERAKEYLPEGTEALDYISAKPEEWELLIERAVDELVRISGQNWKIINDAISKDKSKRLESQVIRDLQVSDLLTLGLNDQPITFTEEDREIFYETRSEAKRLNNNPDEHSINLLQALTAEENKLIKQIEEYGVYYSPVEQEVYNTLWFSELVRLEAEKTTKIARGELTSENQESWYAEEVRKRRNYVRIGVTNARQLMIVTSHLPKINASFGDLGPDITFRGFDMEYLLRGFNHEIMMHTRYKHYGSDLAKEYSSQLYLKFFRDNFGKKLGLDKFEKWNRLIDDASKRLDKEGEPDAYSGYKEVVNYMMDKLGIPYSMMFPAHFMEIGGIFDPGSWRDQLSNRSKIEDVLNQTGKLGAIDSEDRFEYALGIQIEVAGDLNKEEVARAADEFKTMKVLLKRIKDEQTNETSRRGTKSQEANKAKNFVLARLEHGDMVLIDTMLEKIRSYQDVLASGDQQLVPTRRKEVQDLFNSEDFKKNLKAEMEIERKKHVLMQTASRMPTVIAQFYPGDTLSLLREKIGDDYEKMEQIWGKLQNALYATQNDIVRHKVANKNVNSYFGREQQEYPTLDTYLKQFFTEDEYREYADTCFEITKGLRNYFKDMVDGNAGRASRSGLDEEDRKWIGMEQFVLNSKLELPITRLSDTLFEEKQLGAEGGDAVLKRRNHEIDTMAKMLPGALDGIIGNIHKEDMGDIIGKIAEFVHVYAGVHGEEGAAMRGRNILEGWIELVRAPRFMKDIPILEGPLRWLVGREEGMLKDFALKNSGSRLMKITRSPHAAVLQTNEIRQLIDMGWNVDLFFEQNENFEKLYKEFQTTNKDLTKHQLIAILPYVAIALAALIVVQGWVVLQQGEEEG